MKVIVETNWVNLNGRIISRTNLLFHRVSLRVAASNPPRLFKGQRKDIWCHIKVRVWKLRFDLSITRWPQFDASPSISFQVMSCSTKMAHTLNFGLHVSWFRRKLHWLCHGTGQRSNTAKNRNIRDGKVKFGHLCINNLFEIQREAEIKHTTIKNRPKTKTYPHR